MKLNDLTPAENSVQKAWRVGRGIGTGNGKTCGRGHKGQKSRSGYSRKRGFEGGQMPLARRLPKRGFNNPYAKPLTAVNLDIFDVFNDGDVVSAETLLAAGMISKCPYGLKVLGGGEIKKKITVRASAFSASAAAKIAAAGGKAEVTGAC
ncbi:MAG: 50S ribosomal protein L15 [Oscillospiraceae bacterium]|nr:50S ribosomal protein L15 [Oscillospiraceae bacterium]